jgi:caffeoyl-CoA O-methyltransferase
MESKSFIDATLSAYIDQVSPTEDPLLARLREETSTHPDAEMQITPLQGQLLQILVKAIGARRTLEIGVFTGYSSLSVAMALPPDGHLIALDVSEEFTSVARRYWNEGGLAHKIELKIAPASDSLDALIAAGQSSRFDFAFIDADKASYPIYFEKCLALLRPSGLIAIDNTLQHGRVADPADNQPNTIAIRDFNRQMRDDPRVLKILLPIADGLTLAVKL